MANVFISYARRDKERVARLTEALEGEGLSVWWDSDLVPGRRYRTIIAEQLAAADSVIVVWTAAALQSDWVQDEAEEARQRGVLIPVTLELVRPPAGFRQVQAADLSQWTGSPQHPDFRSLVFAVRSLVQVAEAGRRTSAPPTPAPGQVVPAPEAAQTEPEPAEPEPEGPRSHPLSAAPAPAQAHPAPEPDPPPSVAQAIVASEPAVSTTPQRTEAPQPATTSPATPPDVAASRPTRRGGPAAVVFDWRGWLVAAAAVLLIPEMFRREIVEAFQTAPPPPLYFLVLAPATAALLAARGGPLGPRTKAVAPWVSGAGALMGAAAPVLIGMGTDHPIFEFLFCGLLGASVAFVAAVGGARLAGEAAAARFGGGVGAIAFSWVWWLASAIAMALTATAIDLAQHSSFAEPFLFAIVPLPAALLAIAGTRLGVGPVTKVIVGWLSLAGLLAGAVEPIFNHPGDAMPVAGLMVILGLSGAAAVFAVGALCALLARLTTLALRGRARDASGGLAAASAPSHSSLRIEPQASPDSTLSARPVAAAFSWQWWLAAALAHLIAVATICSADHDFVVWPFLFAGAPIVAALLAAASQRAGLGARTRRWVAWPSFAAGLLTVAWFVTRSHNRQVELAFGSVFFFITATGGVFILCAGVALLAHAARPRRRPMVGTAPAREGGDHRGR